MPVGFATHAQLSKLCCCQLYWTIMLKYCMCMLPASHPVCYPAAFKVLQGNASAVIQSWHVSSFYCQNKSVNPFESFFNVKTTRAAKCCNYSMSAAGEGGREREKEINWGCLALLWWSCRVGTGPYGNAGHMEAEEACSSCCIQDYGYKCRRSVWLMELIC